MTYISQTLTDATGALLPRHESKLSKVGCVSRKVITDSQNEMASGDFILSTNSPENMFTAWGVKFFSPENFVCMCAGFGAEPKMIQSSQPVWSRHEEPNMAEWAPVQRCAQPRTVWARYVSPQSPPAKLYSDKFGSSGQDQTG